MSDVDDEFKAPPGVERWPDGEAILVVRPENPPLAVSLAEVAFKHQSVAALVEATSGPCTFVGYLKRTKDGGSVVVDEKGENPQPIKVGDVFVSRHEVTKPD